jgi:hypothetical protein
MQRFLDYSKRRLESGRSREWTTSKYQGAKECHRQDDLVIGVGECGQLKGDYLSGMHKTDR